MNNLKHMKNSRVIKFERNSNCILSFYYIYFNQKINLKFEMQMSTFRNYVKKFNLFTLYLNYIYIHIYILY